MNLGNRRELVFALSGLLLAAILIGGVFWLWSDEDEVVIRRTLEELVESARKSGDETAFVLLMETQDIVKGFVDDPEVDLGRPAPVLRGSDELQSFVFQSRNNLDDIDIELGEMEIDVAEDRETAEMNLFVEAKASYLGDTYHDVREFRIHWSREDSDWRIARVEMLERLIPEDAEPLIDVGLD